MKSKKFVKILSGLFAATMLLASCGGGSTATDGTLRLASSVIPNSLNNLTTSEAVNFQIMSNYTEGLVTYDKDGEVIGSMAESWDVSDDNLTYTFNLRDGIVWSNGDPVTADDFVFGWRTLGQTADAAYGSMLSDVKNGQALLDGTAKPEDLGVVAKDEKTLVVTLEAARPYFIKLMAFAPFFPVNEKFFTEVGADNYGTSKETVLANGPYVLTDYQPELQYILEKNEDYWDAANVKLNKVDTRIVTTLSTQAAMYDNKEIDRLQLGAADLMDQYADAPEMVKQDESAVFYFYLSGNTGKPDEILANKNFRNAVAYAIDKDTLANGVLRNGSKGIDYIVPTSFDALNGKTYREYSGKHNDLKFNVEKANEFLEAAKAELGKDTLEFEIAVSETETGKKIYEYIQAQIQDNLPGVKVNLKFVPQAQYYPLLREFSTPSGSAGWGADFVDVATYFSIYRSFDDHNYAMYNSPEYDKLVADAEKQTTPEARWDMFMQAEDVLIDDAVIIPIYQRGASTLLNPAVEGYKLNATSPDVFFKHISMK